MIMFFAKKAVKNIYFAKFHEKKVVIREIVTIFAIMPKVLLLCDYNREPERRLLRGVVKYANECGGWEFIPVNPALRESQDKAMDIIASARQYKVDAIVGNWPGILPEKARELKIPVVLRKFSNSPHDFPLLSGRNKEIGEIAAEYFIERHYDSYAFFGLESADWAKERMEGFRNKVKSHGNFSQLLLNNINDYDSEAERWLQALPKPLALFACNDLCAQYITEICRIAHIRIPTDIALMGADDDEFLCNISYPGITSIKLDFEKQGYELAQKLDLMINSGQIRPYRIPLDPVGIVERGSTRRYKINDPYVQIIVDRMEKRFTEDVGISDLTEDIPLSRRSIELRFKAEMSPYSMLQFLNMLRIRHFSNLLKNTTLPISEAAERSGFDEPYKVFRQFKKKFGCTPLEYRKKFRPWA